MRLRRGETGPPSVDHEQLAQEAQELAESLKPDPEATAGSVKVTRLRAPGVDVQQVARTLEGWYRTQKLSTQMLESGSRDRAVVQCQSAKWQAAVGMSTALTVVLQRDGPDLAVEIGKARWADKGVAAGLGLVVQPLLITAAWGAWKSFRLPQQTIAIVKTAIASAPSREDVASTATPATPTPRPTQVDVNVAPAEEIAALPGVGVVGAHQAVAARPFHSIEDFIAAAGLKPHVLEQLRPLVTLSHVEREVPSEPKPKEPLRGRVLE